MSLVGICDCSAHKQPRKWRSAGSLNSLTLTPLGRQFNLFDLPWQSRTGTEQKQNNASDRQPSVAAEFELVASAPPAGSHGMKRTS